MKIFFNREAQKSDIVRDRRNLILGLHGMLAWQLQSQAEDGSGGGSLTKEQLTRHTREFLAQYDHDVALAEVLLAGSMERVGALVSRVQGTFEFEVQPLREYFAARHLYTTAPYSPAGRPQSGTRPERFEALARNWYWTNVARFFCGFYDVGELGTLVEGMLKLGEEEDYDLANRPRELALMLLGDHVFSESPREMKRLMGFVVEEGGFGRFVACWDRRQQLRLPDTAGRELLFAACERKFENSRDQSARRMFAEAMGRSGTSEELTRRWWSGRGSIVREEDLDEAFDMGILDHLKWSEIGPRTTDDTGTRLSWLMLTGRFAEIANDEVLYGLAAGEFFGERARFPEDLEYGSDAFAPLQVLSEVLDVGQLEAVVRGRGNGDEDVVDLVSWGTAADYEERLAAFGAEERTEFQRGLGAFAIFVLEHMRTGISGWRSSLRPWTALVDRGLEVAQGSALFEAIAAVATGVDGGRVGDESRDGGFGRTKGLVERVYGASRRGGELEWWREHLEGENAELGWGVLLAAADGGVVRDLLAQVGPRVEALSRGAWARLSANYWRVSRGIGGRRKEVGEGWFNDVGAMGARTALVMIWRVADPSARRRIARRLFRDYEGSDWAVLRGVAKCENVDGKWSGADWQWLSWLSRRGAEVRTGSSRAGAIERSRWVGGAGGGGEGGVERWRWTLQTICNIM